MFCVKPKADRVFAIEDLESHVLPVADLAKYTLYIYTSFTSPVKGKFIVKEFGLLLILSSPPPLPESP